MRSAPPLSISLLFHIIAYNPVATVPTRADAHRHKQKRRCSISLNCLADFTHFAIFCISQRPLPIFLYIKIDTQSASQPALIASISLLPLWEQYQKYPVRLICAHVGTKINATSTNFADIKKSNGMKLNSDLK